MKQVEGRMTDHKHECPVCGQCWNSDGQIKTKLLICVRCYLSPAMFAVMNAGLIDSGLGFRARVHGRKAVNEFP